MARGLVGHRLEGDVGALEQIAGHRDRDTVVFGQVVDTVDLLLRAHRRARCPAHPSARRIDVPPALTGARVLWWSADHVESVVAASQHPMDVVRNAGRPTVFRPPRRHPAVAGQHRRGDPDVLGIHPDRVADADPFLVRARMGAAVRAHRFDFQCAVTEGELATSLPPDEVAAFSDQLVVAALGYVSDLGGHCCLLARSLPGSRGPPTRPATRSTTTRPHRGPGCRRAPSRQWGPHDPFYLATVTFSHTGVTCRTAVTGCGSIVRGESRGDKGSEVHYLCR